MYRVQSRKVWKLVKSVVGPGCAVEKLGMDELFVDTTSLVEQHLRCLDDADGTGPIPFQCHGEHHFFYEPASTVGYAAPGEAASITQRHLIATHLAAYIREAIHRELGLTVSGGVADNKLMSKLLAAVNKPAKQTCLALNEPEQLQSFLDGMSLQKSAFPSCSLVSVSVAADKLIGYLALAIALVRPLSGTLIRLTRQQTSLLKSVSLFKTSERAVQRSSSAHGWIPLPTAPACGTCCTVKMTSLSP